MEFFTQRSIRMAFLATNGLFWFLSVGILCYIISVEQRWPNVLTVLGPHMIGMAYAAVFVGLIFFFTGFCGCLAGTRINKCLFKTYLIFSAVGLFAQFIVILYIMLTQKGEISDDRWINMGGSSRNVVQKELSCCGYEGPHDQLGPGAMHVSCFMALPSEDITYYIRHPIGCRQKIADFLTPHWPILKGFLTTIILIQTVGIAFGVKIFRMIRVPTASDKEKKRPQLRYNFDSGPSTKRSD